MASFLSIARLSSGPRILSGRFRTSKASGSSAAAELYQPAKWLTYGPPVIARSGATKQSRSRRRTNRPSGLRTRLLRRYAPRNDRSCTLAESLSFGGLVLPETFASNSSMRPGLALVDVDWPASSKTCPSGQDTTAERQVPMTFLLSRNFARTLEALMTGLIPTAFEVNWSISARSSARFTTKTRRRQNSTRPAAASAPCLSVFVS